MPTDYSQWQSCEHDEEPRDQWRDLFGPFWAEIGPEDRPGPRGWSWTILERDSADEIAGGYAGSEAAAKQAVQDWADANKDRRPTPRYRWNTHAAPSGRGCLWSGMAISERLYLGEVTGDRHCPYNCPDSTTEEVPA
jgi:hypothetical protein